MTALNTLTEKLVQWLTFNTDENDEDEARPVAYRALCKGNDGDERCIPGVIYNTIEPGIDRDIRKHKEETGHDMKKQALYLNGDTDD